MSGFTPFATGFNSAGYNGSNYEELLDVDRDVIVLFLKGFRLMGIMPRSIEGIGACVGAGPTPLDGQLASIFLRDGSRIKALDIGNGNLIDMAFRVGNGVHIYEGEDTLGKKLKIDTLGPWGKFDNEILDRGTQIFGDPAPFERNFQRYQRMVSPIYGDINRLPREEFSMGTSFYCAESASPFVDQVEYMWSSFFHSLKDGAPFAIAIVAESEGYSAGKYTKFPATNLKVQDMHAILSRMPISYRLWVTVHTFRPGHGGVIVVVGRKMKVPVR